MNDQPERWLSVEGIALHLGVSKETVYRWLDRGKIPAHRIGPGETQKAIQEDKSLKILVLPKLCKINYRITAC